MTLRSIAAAIFVVTAIAVGPAWAQDGAKVYEASKCSMCHSIAGKGGKLALDGVGSKLSAAEIQEWITKPAEAAKKHNSTAKPAMRAYPNMPKADLDALVAYLGTLKK